MSWVSPAAWDRLFADTVALVDRGGREIGAVLSSGSSSVLLVSGSRGR